MARKTSQEVKMELEEDHDPYTGISIYYDENDIPHILAKNER